MNIKEITLGQLDELKNILGMTHSAVHTNDVDEGRLQIFVLQRGWVVVGRRNREGSTIRINNASVIRVWGATSGLGEIAANGPSQSTILDPLPYGATVHELGIVMAINCTESRWT